MRDPHLTSAGRRESLGTPWPRLIGAGLMVTLLIALVVLASRPAGVVRGDGAVNTGSLLTIAHVVVVAGIALEVFLLLLLVFARRARRSPDDDEDDPYREPIPLPWPVKVALVLVPLLLLIGVIVAILRFRHAVLPAVISPTGLGPMPSPVNAPPGGGPGFSLAWWEIGLAVALAAAGFVAFLLALRQPSFAGVEVAAAPDRRQAALATAVAAGLHDARREPDPRRAVITAYATLEHRLASRGLPRRAAEAPLEYMGRLFRELAVSADALRTLTELFELARFSHHPIAPAVRDRAIAALVTIEDDLRRTA